MTIEEKRNALIECYRENIEMHMKDLRKATEILNSIIAEKVKAFDQFGVNVKYFRKNGIEYTLEIALRDVNTEFECLEKSQSELEKYKYCSNDTISKDYAFHELVMSIMENKE